MVYTIESPLNRRPANFELKRVKVEEIRVKKDDRHSLLQKLTALSLAKSNPLASRIRCIPKD
jgi:hypothetical protein